MRSPVAAVSALLQLRVAIGCCSYPWLGLPRAQKISMMELQQPHALDSHESTQRSNPSAPLAPVVFRPLILIAGGGAVDSTVYDEAGAWFLFHALDGRTYQIETEPGTLTDTTISLLDRAEHGGWTTLVENDDDTRTSGRLTSYLEWPCPRSSLSRIYSLRVIYINVRGYGSTRGDFSVKVSMARQQSDGHALRSKVEGLVEPTTGAGVYWEAVRAHTIEMKQQEQQTWQHSLLGQAACLSLAGCAAICRCVAPRLQRRQLPAAPPDHLLCSITRELFIDPVLLVESGQTYERSMITRWLHTNRTDPVSNTELRTKKLVPNIALRHSVELWQDGQCADRAAVGLDLAAAVKRSSVEPAGARLKT